MLAFFRKTDFISHEGRASMSDIPQLRTAGVIAQELGAPLSRVLYALTKLNVKPIGRAGVLRLYDRAAVETVRQELNAIDQRQGVTSAE
jgi:hypothetical protein